MAFCQQYGYSIRSATEKAKNVSSDRCSECLGLISFALIYCSRKALSQVFCAYGKTGRALLLFWRINQVGSAHCQRS